MSRSRLLLLGFSCKVCNALYDMALRWMASRAEKPAFPERSVRREAALHDFSGSHQRRKITSKLRTFNFLTARRLSSKLQNLGLDLGRLGSGHGPGLSGSLGSGDRLPPVLGEELGGDGELVEARESSGLDGHGIAKDHRLRG